MSQLLGSIIPSAEDGDVRRMARLHRATDNLPPWYRQAVWIKDAARKLGLQDLVAETAREYLARVHARMKRNWSTKAAVLALACRSHGFDRTAEIARLASVGAVRLTILMHAVASALGVEVARPDGRRSLLEAVDALGLPRHVYHDVAALMRRYRHDGYRDRTLFAAFVYGLTDRCQEDVAEAFGVSVFTVREAWAKLRNGDFSG